MLQKLKTLTLAVSLLFSFSAPILVTTSAYAITQTDINKQVCKGANLNNLDSLGTAAGETCTTEGTGISGIIKKIINVLSVLVGAIAVIMVIFGGFRYVTSAGSESGVAAAKKTIMYALIGLVIVALAQVVVHFVLNNIG